MIDQMTISNTSAFVMHISRCCVQTILFGKNQSSMQIAAEAKHNINTKTEKKCVPFDYFNTLVIPLYCSCFNPYPLC